MPGSNICNCKCFFFFNTGSFVIETYQTINDKFYILFIAIVVVTFLEMYS